MPTDDDFGFVLLLRLLCDGGIVCSAELKPVLDRGEMDSSGESSGRISWRVERNQARRKRDVREPRTRT